MAIGTATDTPTVAAIRAMQKRFANELVNGRRLEVMNELYAEDAVVKVPVRPQPVYGAEGFAGIVALMFKGFPDFHAEIVESIIDVATDGVGHMAIAALDTTGTHDGEWFGIAPTGKSARWMTIHMWHVLDGRVVADHVIADYSSLFAQLGLVRPPGRAPTFARRPVKKGDGR